MNPLAFSNAIESCPDERAFRRVLWTVVVIALMFAAFSIGRITAHTDPAQTKEESR